MYSVTGVRESGAPRDTGTTGHYAPQAKPRLARFKVLSPITVHWVGIHLQAKNKLEGFRYGEVLRGKFEIQIFGAYFDFCYIHSAWCCPGIELFHVLWWVYYVPGPSSSKFMLCLTRPVFGLRPIHDFVKVNVGAGSDTFSWGTKGQLNCLG